MATSARRARPRPPATCVGRWRRRQHPAEPRGDQVAAGDDHDQQLRAEQSQEERTEDGEADDERRLQREHEETVGLHQLLAVDDARDHRRLGGTEERRERGHDRDQEVEGEDVVAREEQRDEADATRDVARDEDLAAVVLVAVDTRDRAEEHRWHQEGQQQQSGRRRLAGQHGHGHRQPVQDHVAADLGQELREVERKEPRVSEDVPGQTARRLELRAGRRVHAGASVSRAASAGRSTRRMRPSSSLRGITTRRPQVSQRIPMSAPSRMTVHATPPQGCGFRRKSESPSRTSSTDPLPDGRVEGLRGSTPGRSGQVRSRRPSANQRSRATRLSGPSDCQSGGTGPGGAGCGPTGCGAVVPSDSSHATSNAARFRPVAAVNAWSSVTPSA